jgi:hypothetical protein
MSLQAGFPVLDVLLCCLTRGRTALVLMALFAARAAVAQSLSVVAVSPPPNALAVPAGSSISVTFNKAVNPSTITPARFWTFGRWSGTASGTFAFSNGNATVTFTPSQPFSAGETVMVILNHDIQATDGAFLREAGYSQLFWIRSQTAAMSFALCEQFSTRSDPKELVRSYGGFAADLDEDGRLDLAIVNEISEDLRVFLRQRGSTCQYGDMLEPPSPCGAIASPSETADFNHDGHTDACVVNVADDSVSILLGQGDGTFAPQQSVTVGDNPRGVCVLDADGDGDLDIVNTNTVSDNLSLLLNNGAGLFGGPTFLPTGGTGEFAIAAADMTGDGIMDLVVGANSSQQIVIRRGNGDGTFSSHSNQLAGGQVRQIAVGDIDADGDADVCCAGGMSNIASVLRNDGNGFLAAAEIYPVGSYAGASDLGDLDGDGDLDFAVSSFFGQWQLLLNNGDGDLIEGESFDPPQIASCAIIYDVDNDGDVDLALIDELEDVVLIMKNSGTASSADLNHDGVVGPADLAALLSQWGQCQAPTPCDADIAPPGGDGMVGPFDLSTLLSDWS